MAQVQDKRGMGYAHLERTAFPMGGMGAGMICLEGTGAFSHVSLRHKPELFNEPMMFSTVHVPGMATGARVLEGPVPDWKVFFPGGDWLRSAGNGNHGKLYGLPRFSEAKFHAKFPFAQVDLHQPGLPLDITITGWSPFTPGDSESACLPVAGVEYTFRNTGTEPIDCVYGFHSFHFLNPGTGSAFMGMEQAALARGVRDVPGGFEFWLDGTEEKPWLKSWFRAEVDTKGACPDVRWFRGGWFDPASMLWKRITSGEVQTRSTFAEGELPSPGGSVYLPLHLEPGESVTVPLRLSWYVPESNLRFGADEEESSCGEGCTCSSAPSPEKETYRPWYATRFSDMKTLATHWRETYARYKGEAEAFAAALFDTNLPSDMLDAIQANLTILKSPTAMRQHDGRMWLWEGCCDGGGCCDGSCTHVWNYAHALAHLFPDLERTLRQTEFCENQIDSGHQGFRAALPIRPLAKKTFEHPGAADGQLGGVMKMYREWRISGDTAWLREQWPQVRQSLEYCISTWDPKETGLLVEPHHNTYDIEFWGADGMCSSFYLGALQAAAIMADTLDAPDDATHYREIYTHGRTRLERDLWNGEYFIQKQTLIETTTNAENFKPMMDMDSGQVPEISALEEAEGPRYQYGNGCLTDGILGAWMAWACGVGEIVDAGKYRGHTEAVVRHNFRATMNDHANPQRPGFALGNEGGLLTCSWPHDDALSIPFPYSNEVWTGQEYHIAAALLAFGNVPAAEQIVSTVRARYDGKRRNPFNEYECGSWYGRALSSYTLLQAWTGARYDAVEKTLYVLDAGAPRRGLLVTANGYGTVNVAEGKVTFEPVAGTVPIENIVTEGSA